MCNMIKIFNTISGSKWFRNAGSYSGILCQCIQFLCSLPFLVGLYCSLCCYHSPLLRSPKVRQYPMTIKDLAKLPIFVSKRYLIMAWGTNKFTKKLLRPNAVNNNELADFISRVPDNEELVGQLVIVSPTLVIIFSF